jgi:hypothetical protein
MSNSSPNTSFIPRDRTYLPNQFPNSEHYSNALFTCTDQASFNLVHCSIHHSQLPTSFSTSKKFPWCIILSCDNCQSYWSVCSKCTNVRSRIVNRNQCNRHHAKYHLSTLTNNPILAPNPPPTIALPPPPTTPVSSPPPNPHQCLPTFSRIESFHYFSNNQNGHLGPASLVSLSHLRNRHCCHQISPQDVYNQILIAQHSSDLTKGQNKKFAHLLHNLISTFPISPPPPHLYSPKLPTTFAEIRQKCTEGPNSVVMNLPYPEIQTNVPGHSFVKISHVLEDFLAHGFLPMQPSIHQSEDWVTHISQSPQLVSSLQKAITKYGQEPFYFIAYKEWQDDYESQYARKDRGSVWCKNITILAEPGTPRHLCTYPIAFSGKQKEHHMVESMIKQDMQRFKGDGPNLFLGAS